MMKRWDRGLVSMIGLLAALLLITPLISLAHPLGNFTLNHYSRIEVAPSQVRIFYVLDMAEIPAFQTIQEITQSANGQVSASQAAAYAQTKMEELRQGVQLTLNGTPVSLKGNNPELTFPPGQGGLSLLRLTFTLEGALPAVSQSALSAQFRDSNDAGRLGWREIIVRGVNGLQVLDSTVSDQDQSNELRSYPQDMLASPLNETSAGFSFRAGSGGSQSLSSAAPATQLGAANTDAAFAALITTPNLEPSVILFALLTALALGAVHALEPGHGKTAAASYLVGSRATPRHAVILGLTITTMHTSSVFMLGLVTLFASSLIVPERLLPWLGLASGLIVVGIGLRMFFSRLRQSPLADSHEPNHDHPHPHGHEEHNHGHSHDPDHLPSILTGARMGWRGLLAIGISGGLLPCPAALVVLLSAIGLGRVGFGLLLIVAFSAGLALVLSGIGLTVLYSGRYLSRQPGLLRMAEQSPLLSWATRYLPALSSLLVVGAGFLLLYHAWPLLRVFQS